MINQFEKTFIKPAYLRVSPVSINDTASNRLMIVLKTIGCEYARATGGCIICGFMNNAVDEIKEGDIESQLEFALEKTDLEGIGEVDLLTLGSFFNNNEVSGNTRRNLMKIVSKLENVKRVSIESRSEYVEIEKLKECKEILGDKILEFGIGLESSNDYIRNKVIKKGLSKRSFEDAVNKVKQAGADLLVYILIKPPTTNEKQAIEDAVNSAKYVFDVAQKYGVNVRVAFEPVFICSNTKLEELFLKSEYMILNLWTVVEVIKKVHMLGNVFVGLSDEALSSDRMPYSCSECNTELIEEIELFNNTQDASRLYKLDCICREEYISNLEEGII